MKFSNSTWIKSLGAAVLLAFSVPHLSAQTDLGSPYSVFGPGMAVKRQSVTQFGMGGTGAAFGDAYRFNLVNPASAANLVEPVFQASGIGSLSTFSSDGGSFDNQRFFVNNLGMAYPIKRGVWNLNLGIVPLTEKNYDFTTVEQTETLGAYRAEYRGDGGISQAYIGTAYKIYNKIDTANNVTSFSLGLQGNFNFGPINSLRRLTFPDDPRAMGISVRERFLVRSPSLEVGFQYQTNIIKRNTRSPRYLTFLAGGVYRFGAALSAERSNYVYNFRPTPAGNESPRDTIFSSERARGSINMPGELIAGFGFDYVSNKRQRLRFGMDYSFRDWGEFSQSFDGETSDLGFGAFQRISAGVEYTPNTGGMKTLERIEYRMGFRAERTGMVISGTEIEDYALSVGLSVPVNFRRNLSRSRFSIGAETGSFGTTENGLIRENYVRFMAGFSLTPHFRNRWFVKPKYD